MMTISPVGNKGPVVPAVPPSAVAPAQPASAPKRSDLYITPARTDSLSRPPSATYTKADASGARKSNAMDAILSRMAEKIITKQYSEGNQFYKLLYGNIALRIDPNLRSKDMGPSREELLARAREAVGDNGTFSPEKVAGQIVGFVGELSGGDQAKTERFREAVHEAFVKLAVMSGGQMPELTQKTYDAVMDSLSKPVQPQEAAIAG